MEIENNAPEERPRRRQRKTSQKAEDRPLWLELLFLIPKNLVYVFALIIVFAFLGMLYITYSEKNMTEFLQYDRSKETVTINPLFSQLQKSMHIKQQPKIPEEQVANLNTKKFNANYLQKNQPVVVRSMAKEWESTKEWNFEYLSKKAGDTSILYSHLVKKKDSAGAPWSFAKQIPMHLSGSFKQALASVKANPQSSKDPIRPTLYMIDDEILRGSALRQDYEYPYLHEFMRMRSTSISVWPPEISHIRPRQSRGEQFMCVIDGTLNLKMMSSVFGQNCYQGVFEDLNPVEVPEDLSFFEDMPEKYPMLSEVRGYIQSTQLKKGDCVYMPSFWFYQYKAEGKNTIFLNFFYESSSKLSELFVDAIHQGVLDKPETPQINIPSIDVDVKGMLGIP